MSAQTDSWLESADNGHQAINRYKKARKIANFLRDLGVTELVEEPSKELREKVALAAGTHLPSLTTWALARYLLTEDPDA